MKQSINRHLTRLTIVGLLVAVGYAHGLRIADLSETPASQRPSHIVVAGRAL